MYYKRKQWCVVFLPYIGNWQVSFGTMGSSKCHSALNPLSQADDPQHPESPGYPQLWTPCVRAPAECQRRHTQRRTESFCKPRRCGADAGEGGTKGMEADAWEFLPSTPTCRFQFELSFANACVK